MRNTPVNPAPAAGPCPRPASLPAFFATLFLASASLLNAAAPWGGPVMQPGIGAISCAVPASTPTNMAFGFAVMDFRNPPAPFYGPFGSSAPLWNPPAYHHPQWTMTEIGSLYGITIDADGDIYTAAHGLYSKTWGFSYYHRYGDIGGGPTDLTAAGTIYKIDRITGVPTVFAVIPGQQTMNLGAGWNSGPGIGNLAYDSVHDQFFATSLEDGIIYRIDNTGAIVQTFDPLGADNGAAGMPAVSELLWGIEVSRAGLHYAVWNTGSLTDPGKIRRVDILGSGALDTASDIEILTVPGSPMGGGAYFVPVADITFSADGTRMVLGERSMLGLANSYNHASRVHIATLTGVTWTVVNTLETGNSWGRGEAYGGVSYGPEAGASEQVIWMTTADSATTAGPHGIQGTRPADFPPAATPSITTNSYRVPFDPSYTTSGPDFKGSGGDVEIMQSPGCMEITVKEVDCPPTNTVPFEVVLSINNQSGSTAYYALLTPCDSDDLPAGAVTAQPQPAGVIVLATPLAHNTTGSLTVQLPLGLAGNTVCFRVTLLDATGDSCCTKKICVDLPDCSCAEVLDTAVVCEPQADGTIKYTITLTVQNLTHLGPNPYAIGHVSFLPPSGFSPTLVTPSPNPIPPGGIGTITACYYGAPGRLCFNVGLHDESLAECCSPEEICIDLPECGGGGGHPDTCKADRRVACCPPNDTATINYTICNNSTTTRTYTWNADGNPAAGCSQILTPASFSPSTGSVSIPAGGCVTIPIDVRCNGFEISDCAGYRICATYSPNVEPLCCEGTVYRPDPTEPVVKAVGTGDPTGGGISVPIGGSTPLTFDVENMSGAPMDVVLSIRDEIGILTYDGEGSAPGFPAYSTPLTLGPGETRRVSVNGLRGDNGNNSPDFTTLQVWATHAGTFDLGLPALELGVLLKGRQDGAAGGFSVTEIRVETNPVLQVALTIQTERGRLYQLQQARTVLGEWTASDCTTPDTELNEEGLIIGTGGVVTLLVPCNTEDRMMFFRVLGH